MNTINYKVLEKLDEIVYTPENSMDKSEEYTGRDFIELAKGNIQYAEALLNRVSWQFPETLKDEDIRAGEIIIAENQIFMTNGKNYKLK